MGNGYKLRHIVWHIMESSTFRIPYITSLYDFMQIQTNQAVQTNINMAWHVGILLNCSVSLKRTVQSKCRVNIRFET